MLLHIPEVLRLISLSSNLTTILFDIRIVTVFNILPRNCSITSFLTEKDFFPPSVSIIIPSFSIPFNFPVISKFSLDNF